MSAFRRGKRRQLVPSLGTVAIALAAGLGCADAQSPLGASGADLGVHVPILSPEAPLSFGNLADANPLFAVFIAGNIARGSTLEAETLTDPKLGLTLAAAVSEKPSAPEISPPVAYDPTAGPSLSPTQSALRASLERLSRATISATLSAQATGAPFALRSPLSMPGAFMRRCGPAKPA